MFLLTASRRFFRLLRYMVRVHSFQARKSLPSLVTYLLSPLVGLHYFTVYLHLVGRLQERNNAPALFTFRAVNSLVLFKAAHFLYLGVVGRQFSDAQRLLHYDALHLLVPKYRINFFFALVAGVVLVYNYLLLRRPALKLVGLLSEVLLADQKSGGGRRSPGRRGHHRFARHFLLPFYRGKEVTQLIRQFFLLSLKSFHVLLVVIDALLLYTELTYAHQIVFHLLPSFFQQQQQQQDDFYSQLSQLPLLFAFHCLAGVTYAVFFLNLTHIFTLYFATSATLIAILYLQLKQMITFLKNSQKHQHFSSQFSHFQRRYAQATVLLGEINQATNGCFLAFLLVAFPLNATFLSWLIRGQVEHPFFIGAFALYQYVVIMLIHLALTVIIGLVEAPGKVLKSAPVLFQEAVQTKDENEALRRHRKRMTISATVRTKLRLALQIFAIDSKRKLGFTYGPIGLISLAAFVRFLILYSKTAMIIYKQTQLL
ncbi:hypothetical protein TYRP_011534 [Tyrophagus putrescentiae]|nr:hypothetical protein TYRP_011534 [Tyrophagus putrescentiae]